MPDPPPQPEAYPPPDPSPLPTADPAPRIYGPSPAAHTPSPHASPKPSPQGGPPYWQSPNGGPPSWASPHGGPPSSSPPRPGPRSPPPSPPPSPPLTSHQFTLRMYSAVPSDDQSSSVCLGALVYITKLTSRLKQAKRLSVTGNLRCNYARQLNVVTITVPVASATQVATLVQELEERDELEALAEAAYVSCGAAFGIDVPGKDLSDIFGCLSQQQPVGAPDQATAYDLQALCCTTPPPDAPPPPPPPPAINITTADDAIEYDYPELTQGITQVTLMGPSSNLVLSRNAIPFIVDDQNGVLAATCRYGEGRFINLGAESMVMECCKPDSDFDNGVMLLNALKWGATKGLEQMGFANLRVADTRFVDMAGWATFQLGLQGMDFRDPRVAFNEPPMAGDAPPPPSPRSRPPGPAYSRPPPPPPPPPPGSSGSDDFYLSLMDFAMTGYEYTHVYVIPFWDDYYDTDWIVQALLDFLLAGNGLIVVGPDGPIPPWMPQTTYMDPEGAWLGIPMHRHHHRRRSLRSAADVMADVDALMVARRAAGDPRVSVARQRVRPQERLLQTKPTKVTASTNLDGIAAGVGIANSNIGSSTGVKGDPTTNRLFNGPVAATEYLTFLRGQRTFTPTERMIAESTIRNATRFFPETPQNSDLWAPMAQIRLEFPVAFVSLVTEPPITTGTKYSPSPPPPPPSPPVEAFVEPGWAFHGCYRGAMTTVFTSLSIIRFDVRLRPDLLPITIARCGAEAQRAAGRRVSFVGIQNLQCVGLMSNTQLPGTGALVGSFTTAQAAAAAGFCIRTCAGSDLQRCGNVGPNPTTDMQISVYRAM